MIALPYHLTLKECPFCGEEPEGPFMSVYANASIYPTCWIKCKNPDCRSCIEMNAAPITVIEAWNNRA